MLRQIHPTPKRSVIVRHMPLVISQLILSPRREIDLRIKVFQTQALAEFDRSCLLPGEASPDFSQA
jgi:hypothetical protein